MTPRSSCPGGESTPLQGANLRLNYEINNVTDTALGNLARGKPSFCRSDRCLSYRPPGSLLESRGGSILGRAAGCLCPPKMKLLREFVLVLVECRVPGSQQSHEKRQYRTIFALPGQVLLVQSLNNALHRTFHDVRQHLINRDRKSVV